MSQNTFVHKLTKITLDIMFFGAIAGCILLPFFGWGLLDMFRYSIVSAFVYKPVMVAALLGTGLSAIFIMWQLKILLSSLLGGNPFVESNVECFRRMALACCFIACIFIIKCFLIFSVLSAVAVAASLAATLFCLTLKDVFKQAVLYKEENDLTV